MPSILRPGETCWRAVRSRRAGVLVDGAAYFRALRAALLNARRSIHIVGWDIDSRTDLAPDGANDGEPTQLRALLTRLVERRPELAVNLLLWDYSTLYALDREPLPRLSLGWQTPDQIRVCLDDVLPLGACHHQKLVVVDDAVAFCGGLDITGRRWDTSGHASDASDRVDPSGKAYGPFHDVQMVVDGEAATALAEIARDRWAEASCEAPVPLVPTGDPWPDGVAPAFEDVDVGVARTVPRLHERDEAREIEALYLAAVADAERLVYIENQYLTCERFAQALAARLKERPALEVVLVGPRAPHGWLEAKSMGAGRHRFMQRLIDAGVAGRVRLVCPAVDAGADTSTDIMVHSKVMVVDDRFLTVGSANLNNRSMGFDTECNLAIEAGESQTARRAAIAGVRDRLLGEHLGRLPDDVGGRLAAGESALALIDAARDASRRLEPIRDSERLDGAISEVFSPLADPERPIEADQLLLDLFGGVMRREARPWIGRAAVAVAVVLVGIGLWRWTPLSRLANLDVVQPLFEAISAGPYAGIGIILVFVAAGLVVFPVTVLITMTAIVFPPLPAFGYALTGALASAAVAYVLGARLGRPMLRRLMGKRLNAVSRIIDNRGVMAVMMLRVAPVAPFTAINLVCGAARIRFADYAIGSILGMAPGIAVLTALGGSLRDILANPTPATVAAAIAALAAWILLGIGFQRLLGVWRGRRRRGEAER